MISRIKAIYYYKKILQDLETIKQSKINLGDYDGFDFGSIVVTEDRTESKVAKFLARRAEADGYNFAASPVQSVYDGSISTIFRIDNESEEEKAKRAEELRRLVEDMDKRLGLDKLTKSYNDDNIIDFNEFAKKHRK